MSRPHQEREKRMPMPKLVMPFAGGIVGVAVLGAAAFGLASGAASHTDPGKSNLSASTAASGPAGSAGVKANASIAPVTLPSTGSVVGTLPVIPSATGAVNSATGAVSGALNAATGAVNGVVNSATGAVNGVLNTAKGAVNTATGAVNGAVGTVNGIVGGVLPGVLPSASASAGAGVSTGSNKAAVTGFLTQLPAADLTSLLGHLPVAVPNIAGLVANPTSIVGALPLPDLQWLIQTLPVAVPSGLSGLLGNPTGLLGNLLPTLTSLLGNPTALLSDPTSLLGNLPIGDLNGLLSGLPVPVTSLTQLLNNPTDLRFLLSNLPVQVPGNLLP